MSHAASASESAASVCESSESGVRPETAAALLARIAHQQVESRVPTFLAAVVRDGQAVWADVRGDAAGPATRIQSRIGSISKTFTAILIARLRDEGRLDFADRLEQHVPGTPVGDRTIRDLLSHSSGLQAETAGPWWERTPGAEWAGFAPTLSPSMIRHRASGRFHYSNLGYGLLGEVISRLRGRPWYDALRAEVLEPLELRRTTYLPEAPHLSGFAVHPYADVLLPEPAEDAGAMAPAGQLWSTVADLGRLAAFLAGDTGDVLHPATVEEMRQPHAVEDGDTWTAGYGLGVQILKIGGRTLVGHGGSMPGFLAGVYVDVATATGATLLANTTSGVPVTTVGADLIAIVSEREPRLPEAWTPDRTIDARTLEIVGPWYWGPSPFCLRALRDGWLDLAPVGGRGGRASRFRPTERSEEWLGLDGYYAGETLRVVRRADGSVSHLDLATFVYTREPYDLEAPIPGGVDPRGWGTREV